MAQPYQLLEAGPLDLTCLLLATPTPLRQNPLLLFLVLNIEFHVVINTKIEKSEAQATVWDGADIGHEQGESERDQCEFKAWGGSDTFSVCPWGTPIPPWDNNSYYNE